MEKPGIAPLLTSRNSYAAISDQQAMQRNKIWCHEDGFGLWNWCGSQAGVCKSAGQLLLETAGVRVPETSSLRGDHPFAMVPPELLQEKGYSKWPAF